MTLMVLQMSEIINLVTFQFQIPIINYLAFGQALEHQEMLQWQYLAGL
jgi:hypothetical protein